MSQGNAEVTLVSKDYQSFTVEKHIVEPMSELLRLLLEDAAPDATPIFPLPNIDCKSLKKVIEYSEYHWNNPAEKIEKPLKGTVDEVINDFDKKFLEIDQTFLIELLMAAHYLQIKDLVDLTCAKVASILKSGFTSEEIHELFS